MDGQIGRQMEGLMGGWTDEKMEKPLRFAIRNKKLAVSYINFIFFSLQNRTVFHILHKKLIPDRKKIWDLIFFVRSSQGLSDFGGCC